MNAKSRKLISLIQNLRQWRLLPHLNKYAKLSYAQSGEDRIIQYFFDRIGKRRPSYLDIGAHHPFLLNNTAVFSIVGSRGINVEADPLLISDFRRFRPRDINLNIGVSDQEGELDFFSMQLPEFNTFSKEKALACAEWGCRIVSVKKVKVTTIHNIIDEHWRGVFPELLNIDVEGLDIRILKSCNFSRSKPIMICIETSGRTLEEKAATIKQLLDILKPSGFLVYADTYLNTLFLSDDFFHVRR